jgi:hypothetical protein
MRSTRLPALALSAAVLAGACSPGPPPSATASAAAATGTALPSAAGACPENPTLPDLVALDADPGRLSVAYRPDYGTYSESAVACYDDAELRITAYVAPPEGLGGLQEFVITPAWLVARGNWIAVDDALEPEGFFSGPFLPVAIPPGEELAFRDLTGRWVEISGHFSDATAAACRVTERLHPGGPSDDEAKAICGTGFVVTAADPVDGP